MERKYLGLVEANPFYSNCRKEGRNISLTTGVKQVSDGLGGPVGWKDVGRGLIGNRPSKRFLRMAHKYYFPPLLSVIKMPP